MYKINNDVCCTTMERCIKDSNASLHYRSFMRFYTISAPACLLKKNEIWVGYRTTFCPFCGTKLPLDLVEERMDLLEKEYGINDPYDSNQKKRIPKEFKTDAWWKKRGL